MASLETELTAIENGKSYLLRIYLLNVWQWYIFDIEFELKRLNELIRLEHLKGHTAFESHLFNRFGHGMFFFFLVGWTWYVLNLCSLPLFFFLIFNLFFFSFLGNRNPFKNYSTEELCGLLFELFHKKFLEDKCTLSFVVKVNCFIYFLPCFQSWFCWLKLEVNLGYKLSKWV